MTNGYERIIDLSRMLVLTYKKLLSIACWRILTFGQHVTYFLNNDDWFMIRHEHFNTYMEWKFKSLRIWPSEKSIEREFRLRHFWKFFWDNNQKSFWDSRQMFTLNHPVHHNDKSIATIIRNDWLRNSFTRIRNKGWYQQVVVNSKSSKKSRWQSPVDAQ